MHTLEALREALDPRVFWEYRSMLLSGLLYNVGIFVASATGATVIGLVVAIGRLSRPAPVRAAAVGYAEFFRNAPEYILLVWVYYVLPVLVTKVFGVRVTFHPVLAAIATLAITYSGYLSETFRAGILAVPRSNIEAGMSVGMSRALILRRITLPQAVRRVLPESLNQFISLFKSTSFVSLIAIEDLMYRVSMITMEESRPLPLYTWAALVFCAISIIGTQLAQRLSGRWRQRGLA
jgi:polar amino acid transport system permease protein